MIKLKAINSYQNLLAVGCYGNIDCEYETLIYGKNDNIILKNDQRFISFLTKDLSNSFQFEVTNPSVHTVSFTVYTFTGDTRVDFTGGFHEEYLLKPVYF